MTENLLELLKGYATKEVVQAASGFLGESERNTQGAMDGVFSTLLGGLANNARSESGASMIFDLIKNGNHNGGILSNVLDIFTGGENSSTLMKIGVPILKAVFGDRQGAIIDLISGVTGIGKGSSGSLLKMAAPIVMGLLGKLVKDKGLDVGGLARILLGQKDHLAGALPSGFANTMGLSSLNDAFTAQTVSNNYTTREEKAASSSTASYSTSSSERAESSGGGGGWWKKLLPLALLGLLGFLLFPYLKGCGKQAADTTKSVASATGDAVKGAAEGAGDLAGKAVDATKDAASATGNAVKGAAQATGDAVKGAASATGDAVKGAAQATGDAVKGAAEGAGDLAGKAVDATKDAAKATGDAVKGAAEGAVDATKNAANAAGNALTAKKVVSLEIPGGSKLDVSRFGVGLLNFLKSDAKGSSSGFIFDRLHFDDGKSSLTSESKAQLDNLTAILKAYPDAVVRVDAHTDNTGDAAKNKLLSKQRAEAVKKTLTDAGVADKHVLTRGWGDSRPIASNDTDEGKAQNRRVELVVVKK